MIKEYVGIMYKGGRRDEDHAVDVRQGDGYVHGVCDICGKDVENYDVGGVVVPKEDDYVIKDAAMDDEWVVIGCHLVCPDCLKRVKAMKGEIEIVEKGATKGK